MTKTDHTENALSAFQYNTLFLSDIHLGSNKTAAPYLYEFLTHLDFKKLKTLYLVGDIIGGWEHRADRQRPFPEMERRILDVFNYAADQGAQIRYIPGNHDEKLRPLVPMLNKRRGYNVFHENVVFEKESFYETAGPDKKRLKIVHGDQHDPELFAKSYFRPAVFLVSTLYDGLVRVNYNASNLLYSKFGMHVSIAKHLKTGFKSFINYFMTHDSLLHGLKDENFDGVLMGHTHMAGIKEFETGGRKSYLINDGDWVESCTAAGVDDASALPKILHYKQARERLGFGDLPDTGDPHPARFAAMRPRTDRQIRLIHRLWPARNRGKVLRAHDRAMHKLAEHTHDRKQLGVILEDVIGSGVLNSEARRQLRDIFSDIRQGSYMAQRKGLKAIFDRNHAERPLEGEDFTFVRTVVREFGVRAERKMKKHWEALKETSRRLDYPAPDGEKLARIVGNDDAKKFIKRLENRPG